MDIERVNIVVNYDMSEDTDTYLHRVSGSTEGRFYVDKICFSLQVARAGRFGTKGLAITFISDESDAAILNEVQTRFEVQITEMPDEIDVTTYSKDSFHLQYLKHLLCFVFQSKIVNYLVMFNRNELCKLFLFVLSRLLLHLLCHFSFFFSCPEHKDLCMCV